MPHATTQRRILIVDDNRDAADLLAQVLELHGHITRAAYDGQAGLAAIEVFRPDLLFLDIGMPQLDGYQVALRVRQMQHIPQPLLIAFTAWSDDAAKARVRAAGFDQHLTKPADFEVLLETVLNCPSVSL